MSMSVPGRVSLDFLLICSPSPPPARRSPRALFLAALERAAPPIEAEAQSLAGDFQLGQADVVAFGYHRKEGYGRGAFRRRPHTVVAIVAGLQLFAAGRHKAEVFGPVVGNFGIGIVGQFQFQVEAAVIGIIIVKVAGAPGFAGIAPVTAPRLFVQVLVAHSQNIVGPGQVDGGGGDRWRWCGRGEDRRGRVNGDNGVGGRHNIGQGEFHSTGVDVGKELGAGRGAVADPQLRAVDAVIRAEVERAVDVGEVGGEGAFGTGVDIGHQFGAGRGAVGRPQLHAVFAIIGAEKQDAIHFDQMAGIGTGRHNDRLIELKQSPGIGQREG